MHGGVAKADLTAENVAAVKAGLPNLLRHIENVKKFGVPVTVALNHFTGDSDVEVEIIMAACAARLGSRRMSAATGPKAAKALLILRKPWRLWPIAT